MKQRALAIGLAIAAAVASLMLVTSCGSQTTLEKYFTDHPDEWADVEDQIESMAGEMFSIDLTVKDNQIEQIMTYTETFTADAVAEMKAYFESQEAAVIENIQKSIASVESGAGVQGVTWLVQYNNGDGSVIYSKVIDANTKAEQSASTEKAA